MIDCSQSTKYDCVTSIPLVLLKAFLGSGMFRHQSCTSKDHEPIRSVSGERLMRALASFTRTQLINSLSKANSVLRAEPLLCIPRYRQQRQLRGQELSVRLLTRRAAVP